MTKKRDVHDISLNYTTLEGLQKDLAEWIEHFGPNAWINIWGDDVETVISYERDETEAETEARLKNEAAQQQYKEQYERQQFELLKKKYGQ
jgi:hypothetical protein